MNLLSSRPLRTLLFVAVATFLGFCFWDHIKFTPFVFFYPAIVLSSYFGSALLGIVLSVVIVHLFFVQPYYSWKIDPTFIVSELLFIFSASLIAWVTHRLQKTTEEKIANAAYFRFLAEAMPQMVWMTDLDGKDTYSNAQWLEKLGTDLEGLNNGGWSNRIHPDDRKETLERWARSKADGSPYEAEYRIRHKDGQYRWQLSRGVPIKNMRGEAAQWIGTLTDIHELHTQRDLIEKALAERDRSIRARDEFLSIASHELKTPLTSLRLHAEIRKEMIESGGLANFTEEFLKKMFEGDYQQIERLTRLINDMLDISRINSGKISIRKEEFDLSKAVQDLVDRHQLHLRKMGQEVKLRESATVKGRWDRLRVEQAVMNLLTNAARYGRGQPIEVSVHKTDESARVVVRDQGRGIAPENLERIFQRFERCAPTEEASGLGLGLYISKQIVEMHEGSISVKSAVGQGSEFTIDLPIQSSGEMV